MEVSSEDYQLIRIQRWNGGVFHLIYDTVGRSYIYTHRKKGVKIDHDYAGTNEAEAIAGFDDYIAERTKPS